MLHGLLLGRVPFRSSNKEELRKLIIEGDLKELKEAQGVSKEAKELLKRMLEKDPLKRITVQEIMQGPWIGKYKEQKIRQEWGYPSETEEEGEEFQIENGISTPDEVKIQSPKVESQTPEIKGADYPGIENIMMMPLPDYLLKTHSKNDKHSSDLNIRKKKTADYRIKTISKSPNKSPNQQEQMRI